MTFTDRYYANGNMTEHCLALLSYVSKHRNEEQSINLLAEQCGIPYGSLYDILDDFMQYKTESQLFGVAMCYGFDFIIYASYRDATSQYDRGKVIDVVKHDWQKDKYNQRDYMYNERQDEENP